ncbi:MAG: cupin [Candidatus Fischerbacteria bacterium RBG_13_37_8]|uniref:Cupin n=1 Tax=Candidatus Fischerbacteria bacterium RBG_13_37_8 TaxID=1817863 RepID=A0A1F5V7C6_9BACT|nr:MAG: cupin [Candidatus Fischerbacteria bacterium RBG_13_37_8]
MHNKKDGKNYKIALPGVTYKTLVYGERTSLCEFKLEKGSIIPSHSHPHEQTGYMVSGKMNFIIGAETFIAEEGTSWNIPSYIEHSVKVIEDSLVIEVFSPVREDYLP